MRIILGANVYWDSDGSLFLVAPEQWVDYLHGRTDRIPDDNDALPDIELTEISESDFEAIIMSQ